MKKKSVALFTFTLTLIFGASLSILGHLSYGEPIDDEVTQLIQNAPPAELYPDAGIINILDESIVEVFEDGRCKETLHVVFKILNDKGKKDADIEIDYNSRTQTASIIYARTITPEGKIIPLNENAVKVFTPLR